MNVIKLFFISMIVFFFLDMIWISFIAKNMYFNAYSEWLSLENGRLLPNKWAIFMIYALFALGTLTFVLPLAQGELVYAFIYGAVLGLVIYGVYDFTCLAIFKNWPVLVSMIDWAWGTTLFGVSSVITLYLSRYL